MHSLNRTAAQDLPIEAHLNEIDHDRERGALWGDYRLMFGANPTTIDLTAVRDAIDLGEPVTINDQRPERIAVLNT